MSSCRQRMYRTIISNWKDDSKAYTAPHGLKQGGEIFRREAETFDRKQAANAWVVKREAKPANRIQNWITCLL
jgi:hypothetical protein